MQVKPCYMVTSCSILSAVLLCLQPRSSTSLILQNHSWETSKGRRTVLTEMQACVLALIKKVSVYTSRAR